MRSVEDTLLQLILQSDSFTYHVLHLVHMLHLTVLHHAAPIITILDLMLLLSQCLPSATAAPCYAHVLVAPLLLCDLAASSTILLSHTALYLQMSILYHVVVVHDFSCLQLSHVASCFTMHAIIPHHCHAVPLQDLCLAILIICIAAHCCYDCVQVRATTQSGDKSF